MLRSPVSRLRRCPEAYYQNCENAQLHCYHCGAGRGKPTDPLYYSPRIENNLDTHPYTDTLQQKQQRAARQSKRSKAGFKLEHTVTQRIARQTLQSGAVHHNGDAQLLDGLIQVDYKLRRSQNFTLPYEEYSKGLRQGTNAWHLTIERDDKQQYQLVCVTHELFQRLVTLAYQHLE